MNQMSLPQYFQQNGSEFYMSTGGSRVYGTLVLSGKTVSYRMNDGNQPWEDSRDFTTEKQAIAFAKKFAAEMRRCNQRSSVPTLSTFRNF